MGTETQIVPANARILPCKQKNRSTSRSAAANFPLTFSVVNQSCHMTEWGHEGEFAADAFSTTMQD